MSVRVWSNVGTFTYYQQERELEWPPRKTTRPHLRCYCAEVPLPRVRCPSLLRQKLCVWLFITALFITAKNWTQHQLPSLRECSYNYRYEWYRLRHLRSIPKLNGRCGSENTAHGVHHWDSSPAPHLIGVWQVANHITSLSLSFLICSVGDKTPFPSNPTGWQWQPHRNRCESFSFQ